MSCRCPGTWHSPCHQHQTAEALYLLDLQQWQVRGLDFLASACKGGRRGEGAERGNSGLGLQSMSTETLLKRTLPLEGILGSSEFRQPLGEVDIKGSGKCCNRDSHHPLLILFYFIFLFYFVYLFFLFFVFLPFLGLLPRHMEVPRLGV